MFCCLHLAEAAVYKFSIITVKNLRKGKFQKNRRCSKGVLKNFAIFTGKYLYWSLFLKLQAFRHATLLKRRLQHVAKLLIAPILKNLCKQLLLKFLRIFRGIMQIFFRIAFSLYSSLKR